MPSSGLQAYVQAEHCKCKAQMKSRRRENMSKEVRTTRGASTHGDDGTDLMGAHQGQLDWD